MAKVLPTVGVDGLTTTEVTLLELALMVSCTDVNEKSWLVSKLPEAGGPLNTLTVWVCVTLVSALDPRQKNAVFVWPLARGPRSIAPGAPGASVATGDPLAAVKLPMVAQTSA